MQAVRQGYGYLYNASENVYQASDASAQIASGTPAAIPLNAIKETAKVARNIVQAPADLTGTRKQFQQNYDNLDAPQPGTRAGGRKSKIDTIGDIATKNITKRTKDTVEKSKKVKDIGGKIIGFAKKTGIF